jgi:hypothetical protein
MGWTHLTPSSKATQRNVCILQFSCVKQVSFYLRLCRRACDAPHVLLWCICNKKIVFFLWYLCREVSWVGRGFVFKCISSTAVPQVLRDFEIMCRSVPKQKPRVEPEIQLSSLSPPYPYSLDTDLPVWPRQKLGVLYKGWHSEWME